MKIITKTQFNINDDIEATLTDHGVRVLMRKDPIAFKYNFDADTNKFKDQLWHFFEIFSDAIYLGAENCFVGNNIWFIRRKET